MENQATNQKPHLMYSFSFDKLGNYDGTSVTITATLPFRRLHLLYTLPALILKEYWAAIWKNDHPTKLSHEDRLTQLSELENDYHEHLTEIDAFTKAADCFGDFPKLKTKPSREVLLYRKRKLTLVERITGTCIV